jgi:hypothetical protein
MDVDQPKVSALHNGRYFSFSVERLMEMLTALGHGVEIVVKRTRRDARRPRQKKGGEAANFVSSRPGPIPPPRPPNPLASRSSQTHAARNDDHGTGIMVGAARQDSARTETGWPAGEKPRRAGRSAAAGRMWRSAAARRG